MINGFYHMEANISSLASEGEDVSENMREIAQDFDLQLFSMGGN